MVEKLLDDLDTYSDLLLSIGTHDPNRPFTPIEVSDHLLRLKKETGDSLQQLSKRVGLGKKLKKSTIKKPTDTTQIKLFEKLQNLSRRNVYMLGWGISKDGKIAMTIGCDIAKLSNPDEQDIFLNTILESLETDKPIRKDDVKDILNRKRNSPETPIGDIIEHVMKIKPVMELFWKIGITPEDTFLEKFKKKISDEKIQPSDLLRKLLEKKIKKDMIKYVSITKNDLVWITLDENNFKELENEWKSKKIPVTAFFNQILMDEIQND
ncbi:MAG: hypothetical protein ACW9XH_07995 [Candidatus Nitrosopumilus sp. bin_32a]